MNIAIESINLAAESISETAVITTEAATEATNNVTEALMMSGAGMIGIFIVIGVIILSVTLLNKIGSGEKKKDKE